jgi:ribosome recycling factor
MIEEALELGKDAMEKVRERLGVELSRIRAGRANPSLLDGVRVEAYGVQMQLREVATVSTADARLLVVKPYDANNISVIEKAIMNAGLGLNPSSDGVILRVPIPSLTEERRRDLVKQVRKVTEDAKVAVRAARRDANEMIKQAEKDRDISEDACKRGIESVQELTDGFVKLVDDAAKKKESEILDEG